MPPSCGVEYRTLEILHPPEMNLGLIVSWPLRDLYMVLTSRGMEMPPTAETNTVDLLQKEIPVWRSLSSTVHCSSKESQEAPRHSTDVLT